MSSVASLAGLATLDVVIAGLADRINDTLAGVMLNVELLDGMVDDLAEAAGQPLGRAEGVIDEVIDAVARIRDVVKDLQSLTGDDPADAAETLGAVLRLVRAELGTIELVEHVEGPAPTRVPRRRLATAAALTMREVQRAIAGCRGTLTASLATGDGEIAIDVSAELEPRPAHRLDTMAHAWNDVRSVLTAFGGQLAIERGARGFTIALRLPAA